MPRPNPLLLARPLALAMLLAAKPAAAQPAAPLTDAGQLSMPAAAQATGSAPQDGTGDGLDGGTAGAEIVVRADRIRGSIVEDVPPVVELSEEDVAAYGVSSIQDLIAELAPQTGSGRGRGSGRPAVLLNGERVSGFRELRNIPPEAIRKVEVLPEEVALRYGFRPDQRVINFILKPDFRSVEIEIEQAEATRGGRGLSEAGATLTRFGEDSRLNLSGSLLRGTPLLESERGITQSAPGEDVLTVATDPADPGAFRTLIGEEDSAEINAVYTRILAPGSKATLNLGYDRAETRSLFGLDEGLLVVPAGSAFDPAGSGAAISRLVAATGPLARDAVTDTFSAGLAGSRRLGAFDLSLTGDYARVETDTRTDRRADFALLQDAVTAGTLDPFTPDLSPFLPDAGADRATSATDTANVQITAIGVPFELPAGEAGLTLRAGYGHRGIDSVTSQVPGARAKLSRDLGEAAFNIELPIADADRDVLPWLGRLSLNANAGYRNLSDFGSLWEYGGGITFAPTGTLTFTATFIGEEAAPSLTDLGNPVIVTPNVTVFDFTRGETVLASVTTGGNPALLAERRADWKVSGSWDLPFIDRGNLQVEYFRNRSFDTSNSFPLLTPEIEAAFPDRVVRGPDGSLLAIDQRPVTFDRVESERLRTSINLFGRIGSEEQAGGGGRGGRSGGGPAGAGGPGEAGGPPVPGMFGRGGGGGRWNVSAAWTWRLAERIEIAPGVPVLDLLDGSAIGSNGGAARHAVEIEGGFFKDGIGLRASGNFDSGSQVDGDVVTGSSALDFGSLATFDLRAFVDLGSQRWLAEEPGFLQGMRLSLRLDNVFDAVREVRDDSGVVPLRYQPGFIDPLGRRIELELRKQF